MTSRKSNGNEFSFSAQPNEAANRRGKLQNSVYQTIRQSLMAGALLPGQVITLRKLANALGTSPMPVREAIAQLVSANVLESLPNGSAAVPHISKKRFIEITDARKAIEGMAAAAAAEFATARLIKRLAGVNQRLLEAIADRNSIECLASNQEFHFTLYAASKSEVLLPFIETLWLQAGPMMYFSLSAPDVVWDASAHEKILEGLRMQDPDVVRAAIEMDISRTAKSLLNSSVFTKRKYLVPHFHLQD